MILLKLIKFNDYAQTVKITIQISDKKDSVIQNIIVNPLDLYNTSFTDFNNVRSYITNININKQVTDNDFGDFIIADFNFDLLDDFALKNGEGGNGGSEYIYFIQDSNTLFSEDKFLTYSMRYFPTKFDKENKTLINYVNANAYGANENIYKFDTLNKRWKLIKSNYKRV